MRTRFVALDMGGVVCDVHLERYAAALHSAFGVDRDDVARATFASGLWREVEVGRVDGDRFVEGVLRGLGLPVDAAAREALRSAWASVLEVRDELVAELAHLAVPAVAWSNTDPIHAAVLRSHPGLASCVTRWFVSCELGVEKPDRQFFERALAAMAVEPEAVVYVDDRAENVAAAAAVGVDAFCAQSAAEVLGGLRRRSLLAPG